MLTAAKLDAIAAKISCHPIGLVPHRPESWARTGLCYENVRHKVEAAGGRAVYGWMFHSRIVAARLHTGYVIAANHAIWCAPDGIVIDVTPFHTEEKHQPLTSSGHVLFFMDESATPLRQGQAIAPRPSSFHALSDDPELLRYVEHLNQRERSDLDQILQVSAVDRPPQ